MMDDAHGNWTAPYQLARSLCLLAAGAAGVAFGLILLLISRPISKLMGGVK